MMQLENVVLKGADVACILRTLAGPTKVPTIDVDASNKLWKWEDRANAPIRELAAHLVALASLGLDVRCVCDPLGAKRFHTEQPSFERKARRERNRLRALEAKEKIIALQRLMQNDNDRPADFDMKQAERDIASYQKKLKAAETSSLANFMVPSLVDELEAAI